MLNNAELAEPLQKIAEALSKAKGNLRLRASLTPSGPKFEAQSLAEQLGEMIRHSLILHRECILLRATLEAVITHVVSGEGIIRERELVKGVLEELGKLQSQLEEAIASAPAVQAPASRIIKP